MPYPNFKHCILCEDTRPEPGGLATILGYYGHTPDVKILLKDITKPLRSLTFLIAGGEGELKGTINVQVIDERGNSMITNPPKLEINVTTPVGKITNLVFTIGNIKFRGPGKHKVIVEIDGHKLFEDDFQVGLGEEKDFAS